MDLHVVDTSTQVAKAIYHQPFFDRGMTSDMLEAAASFCSLVSMWVGMREVVLYKKLSGDRLFYCCAIPVI